MQNDLILKVPSMINVWFSCGASSAVAAKLAVDKWKEKVRVLYCDTSLDEHPDNLRFLADVETWIGQPVQRIKSTIYSGVDDVIKKERYMSGPKGAKCTGVLKKKPRQAIENPDDYHVFGFSFDEQKRVSRFVQNNPELFLLWPLVDAQLTGEDCKQVLIDAGIRLPALYALGFDHNNCLGCLKATSPAYWDLVRKHFPLVFSKRCVQSRELGVRLVRLRGERIFLDELPPGPFNAPKEKLSCGPECGDSTQ